LVFFIFCLFFFFKQKTAYDMRISDWSSDVCSSDLNNTIQVRVKVAALHFHDARGGRGIDGNHTFTHQVKHHSDELSGGFKALVASIAQWTERPSNVIEGACRSSAIELAASSSDRSSGPTREVAGSGYCASACSSSVGGSSSGAWAFSKLERDRKRTRLDSSH